MNAQIIKNDVYSVGVINPTLRVFDIIMRTEFGTTYNAYLIKDEKNVLLETVHHNFTNAFFRNIQSIVPLESIDYVILNHTEPDHSGSLAVLLEKYPNIEVIGSAAAIKNLKSIMNIDFKSRAVKTGDTLNIGKRVLVFYSAPNLHWPDSIFTWSEYDKIAFTCDFLGAHYCEESRNETELLEPACYARAFESYYEAIFSPFKKFVLAGLDILEKLPVEFVCPSHGPVLKDWKVAATKYRNWSTSPISEKKTAYIVYVSAYGYTRELAKAGAEALSSVGIDTKLVDLVYDTANVAEIMQADLILFGSPTINRDALKPIWDCISSLDAINLGGKRAAAFGSYGWSGEAVPMLTKRLEGLKLKVADGFTVNFRPTEADLEKMKTFVLSLLN